MEYCGAGSVSDIMRLRNKTVSIFSFFFCHLFSFHESIKNISNCPCKFVSSNERIVVFIMKSFLLILLLPLVKLSQNAFHLQISKK